MSKIKLEMYTDQETGEIEIKFKGECTLPELEIATGFLMGKLATSSKEGWETLNQLMFDIESAMTAETGIDKVVKSTGDESEDHS